MSHQHELAEDLTQETFLKALLSLSDSHPNMRAWLFMVARNLYFNYRKHEISTTYSDDLPESQPDDTTDPLTAIIQKEQTLALYRALERLSANKREVLTMHYFGGLSQNEIAEILGLTPANVRVLTLRGKKELKQYLEVSDNDFS